MKNNLKKYLDNILQFKLRKEQIKPITLIATYDAVTNAKINLLTEMMMFIDDFVEGKKMLTIGTNVFIQNSYLRLLQETKSQFSLPEWMIGNELGKIETYRKIKDNVEYLVSFESTPESVWIPASQVFESHDKELLSPSI